MSREYYPPARRLLLRRGLLTSTIALVALVDLSAGGAQVHLGVKLDAGASVRLALHVPSGPALAVDGVVRWCEPAARGFAHGMQFTDLSAEARKQIEQLLGPSGARGRCAAPPSNPDASPK